MKMTLHVLMKLMMSIANDTAAIDVTIVELLLPLLLVLEGAFG